MSSVVISGDISGSVTLDAPSVAGTTVLTLPATSGTVVTTATTTGISGSAITTGTVGVSVGGTGANTLTANNVILGNGTSAVQFVAPGSSGNVLTSNGTTWTSAAAGGGALQTQLFTTPGTWTRPSTVTQVRVTVIGGGSGAGLNGNPSFPGTSGGASSFGSLISATGGSAFGGGSSAGSGTVSTGTALKTGSVYGPNSFVSTYPSTFTSMGIVSGRVVALGLGGSPTYSIGSDTIAGAAGQGGGAAAPSSSGQGFGGLAIGICPVSAPVSVTVGVGGAFNPGSGNLSSGSGQGGAVVVEWVG